jgi:hypothetical protein
MDSVIHLSQAQLNLLELCPPQFQKVYLEELRSPINLEQQANMVWGNRFHLLMQQLELGLPIETTIAADSELQQSVQALVAAIPEVFDSEIFYWREAEHTRTLKIGNYLLKAVYDLFIANDRQAQIIDWKTYLRPKKRQKLAENWQTRLYLYLLVETSDYLPEQVSMTYWFVKLPGSPQSLTFDYSTREHQQTKEDLNLLLTKLDQWLFIAHHQRVDFPHTSACYSCPYHDSFIEKGSNLNDIIAIADIAEIPL